MDYVSSVNCVQSAFLWLVKVMSYVNCGDDG